MSAAGEVQAALVAALASASAGLVSGVFDGPPADAVLPYITIDGGVTLDWSHKTGRGAEHRLGLSVWDETGRAGRLRALLDGAMVAIEALPRDLPSHRIASLAFLRERIVRSATGPWSGQLEYRVRTLET